MHLRTSVGVVERSVCCGYDPGGPCWGCPIRQQWGWSAHPQSSPLWQQKLAFTVTATSSYEQAAAVARQWGCPADDSPLHTLVQRVGARAEAQTQQRWEEWPVEAEPKRPPSALAVLQ